MNFYCKFLKEKWGLGEKKVIPKQNLITNFLCNSHYSRGKSYVTIGDKRVDG